MEGGKKDRMNDKELVEKKLKIIEFVEQFGCNFRDEGDLLVISFPKVQIVSEEPIEEKQGE